MPKHLRKDRHKTANKSGRVDDEEEEVPVEDDVSVCSNISDATSIYDDIEGGSTAGSSAILSSDNLDEKLDAAIEDLRSKDLKTRETALRTLQILFSQKYLPESVEIRSENLVEQLLSCLKKGSTSEGKLAAKVASLFCIQLGEPNDELFSKFRDVIMPVLRDETKSSSLRTSYAQAIGILCFVASEDITSTVELMKSLEAIFAKSYLLQDGTSPIVTRDLQELHTAALSSWCLLFSTMPSGHAHDLIRTYVPEKIPGLIESNDADLRNQAGETIAVLYEIAREINSIFAEPPESLLVTLDKKSTESAKYKGKKEKRVQRATFREISSSFEDGTFPEFTIKFGREVLEISSWTSRLYYYGFSNLLGAGMNVHLKENGLFRSIFNLDDVSADDGQRVKTNRFDRQLANKAAFKLRTQALKKTRANKVIRSQQDD